jgi:hypothetical protein
VFDDSAVPLCKVVPRVNPGRQWPLPPWLIQDLELASYLYPFGHCGWLVTVVVHCEQIFNWPFQVQVYLSGLLGSSVHVGSCGGAGGVGTVMSAPLGPSNVIPVIGVNPLQLGV